MDSENNKPSDKSPEKTRFRPGLLTRILEWLTRGVEKAAREGKTCTT
ncbi:MAG: hypothetical protein ACOC3W_02715 [Thermodesulfobacteriota bacterium]